MDLDNMKNVWSEMSERIEKQNKITNEIILKMAHHDSKNRLSKILRIEIFSALWLLICSVFIILNFNKLDTAITLSGGVVSIIICCLSLFIWLDFLKKANRINIANNSYKQTMIDFNICKKSYQINKKLDYFLGSGLLIAICPVVFKLTRNVEISDIPLSDLLLYIIGGSIASSGLIYMVLRFYSNQINEINKLLEDLHGE